MASNSIELAENEIAITSTKVRNAHAAFVQAKADEKDAKERKAQAEAILRNALPEGKVKAFFGKIKAFSLVASRTTSVNREYLETQYPAVYKDPKVWNTTEYDYIRTA